MQDQMRWRLFCLRAKLQPDRPAECTALALLGQHVESPNMPDIALMNFRSAAFGLIFLLILGASAPVEVRENVTIKSCYDGDTCRTTTKEKIRLACIDTPERKGKRAQPERAKAARDRLRGMVVGRSVNLRRITTDRYGRTVGELYVDGMNVQQAMVASRHAEIYWKYAHQCPWSK